VKGSQIMQFLDYTGFEDYLGRHFGSPGQRRARLAGRDRTYDSGYFDIVRFYGDRSLDPREVHIKFIPGDFEISDKRIRKYVLKIEKQMRKQGRMREGPMATCVVEANLEEPPFYLTVQSCDYGQFAGSCLALDYPDELFGKHRTLREYYKHIQPSSDLRDFPLASCIGICGLLLIKSEKRQNFLFVERAGHLTSLENSVGSSAAGIVDFVSSYNNLDQLIETAMSHEVSEELNLKPDEFSITPLAYAREIFRGEKPQIFCLIKTGLSQKDVFTRLESIPSERREFNGFSVVSLTADFRIKEKEKRILNHEALMNYYLGEEYLALHES